MSAGASTQAWHPPASQPASPPASQPTSQPASPPASQPTSQPASPPASQPTSQPASPPARQPVSQPASPPASPPASDPVSSAANSGSRVIMAALLYCLITWTTSRLSLARLTGCASKCPSIMPEVFNGNSPKSIPHA